MKTNVVMAPARKKRYGITERKKAELDQLANDVLDAQNTVVELQAVVGSLTQKAATYAGFFTEATNNQATALANKNQVNQVIQSALDLLNNSGVTYNETILADAKTKELAKKIKSLIDKLIYSAEVVNKLANTVIRKKEQNPLISDDLVSMINQAGTDANNAVALTLVALQSVFTSQASTIEAEADCAVETEQARTLYLTLIGGTDSTEIEEDSMYGKTLSYNEKPAEQSIAGLLYKAYNKATKKYELAKEANNEIIQQLARATATLNAAQINLNSLQASLAAATAAALAS